jgi:mRNA interferase HigB
VFSVQNGKNESFDKFELQNKIPIFGTKFQMRIVTYKRIAEFIEKHSDSKIALQEWYFKTTKANWKNASEIKKTFNHVDFSGNSRVIFNIKGNQYRLVAIVIFASKKVYIRFIGTYAEYNQIKCTTI